MQLNPSPTPQPLLYNKQTVLTLLEFTPISALLALAGVVLAFTVPPVTPLPFLLLLTPLYINTHSFGLGVVTIVAAVCWPSGQYGREIVVRVALVINALYMISSTNRVEKYRMLPGRVVNSGFPILL